MNKYFIYFTFKKSKGTYGDGYTVFESEKEIEDINDLREIKEHLDKENGNVVISNIIKLPI